MIANFLKSIFGSNSEKNRLEEVNIVDYEEKEITKKEIKISFNGFKLDLDKISYIKINVFSDENGKHTAILTLEENCYDYSHGIGHYTNTYHYKLNHEAFLSFQNNVLPRIEERNIGISKYNLPHSAYERYLEFR